MDFEETLLRYAREVWSNMLELTLQPAALYRPPQDGVRVTGCVQVTGAWRGTVLVECSAEMATRAASILFCEADPDEAAIADTIGELANIIGGNVKGGLPEPSQLSMPSVTTGRHYQVAVPGSKPLGVLNLTCDEQSVRVIVLEQER